MQRINQNIVEWAYAIVFAITVCALVHRAIAQDAPPPLPPPPGVPATPVNPNASSVLLNITAELRYTDPVRMEAVAVRILTTKHGLTTAAAKALLRPYGELDLPRCATYIILARVYIETDGFRAVAAGVTPQP